MNDSEVSANESKVRADESIVDTEGPAAPPAPGPPRAIRSWAHDHMMIPQGNRRWAMEVRLKFDTLCEDGTRPGIYLGLYGPGGNTDVPLDDPDHAFHVFRVEHRTAELVALIDGRVVARTKAAPAQQHRVYIGPQCSVAERTTIYPDHFTARFDSVAFEFERLPCELCARADARGCIWRTEPLASCPSLLASDHKKLFLGGQATNLLMTPTVTRLKSRQTRVEFKSLGDVPMWWPQTPTMSFSDVSISGDFMIADLDEE